MPASWPLTRPRSTRAVQPSGALADARANKRSWLIAATCLGAGSAILMGATPTEWPWLVAAFFFLTNFGFELCWGIYNGFLPEIADDQSMNRVSAWGFAFGYVGGALALIVARSFFAVVRSPAATAASISCMAARRCFISSHADWFELTALTVMGITPGWGAKGQSRGAGIREGSRMPRIAGVWR